jgi:hypothetical protein
MPDTSYLGRAVAGAFEYAEVGAPRAHGVAVLVSHDSRDLVEMGQVVDGPGGEELGEGDHSEGWVSSCAFQILLLQVPRAEFGEVL